MKGKGWKIAPPALQRGNAGKQSANQATEQKIDIQTHMNSQKQRKGKKKRGSMTIIPFLIVSPNQLFPAQMDAKVN